MGPVSEPTPFDSENLWLRRQVLRSVDRWSAGLHECSIYNAYLDVIRSSQHYLYIEVG